MSDDIRAHEGGRNNQTNKLEDRKPKNRVHSVRRASRLQTSEPSKNPLLPTLHSSETDIHLSITTRAKLTTPFDYLRSYSTVAHENGSESIERKFDPKNHAVVKKEKVMVLLVR